MSVAVVLEFERECAASYDALASTSAVHSKSKPLLATIGSLLGTAFKILNPRLPWPHLHMHLPMHLPWHLSYTCTMLPCSRAAAPLDSIDED